MWWYCTSNLSANSYLFEDVKLLQTGLLSITAGLLSITADLLSLIQGLTNTSSCLTTFSTLSVDCDDCKFSNKKYISISNFIW